MSDLFKALAAPFPADRVSWRIGSTTADKKRGMALAYIDARDVMDRLDSVCTPGGWQNRYSHAEGKTVCEIGILFAGLNGSLSAPPIREWIWKADGAGDSDVEAEKGALSDAFKRAAVRWGIGRYLYDVASPWVEIEAAGRSFKIPDSELARLRRMLSNGAPQTATALAAAEPTLPPTSNREPTDFDTLVSDIKKQLGRLSTTVAFDIWKGTEEFRRDYAVLPASYRAIVNDAATKRRIELDQRTKIA